MLTSIVACLLICAAGRAAFAVMAAVCRPRRRALLQAKPEYAARHSATVLIQPS